MHSFLLPLPFPISSGMREEKRRNDNVRLYLTVKMAIV